MKEKVTLKSAHKQMFKNYANFNGRARRSEYWLGSIAYGIICTVLVLIMYIPLIGYYSNGEISMPGLVVMCITGIAALVYMCAGLIPILALSVRRLHDTGKSGWFMLLGLIPYIGSIILLVFAIMDSQPGVNKYGANPKV